MVKWQNDIPLHSSTSSIWPHHFALQTDLQSGVFNKFRMDALLCSLSCVQLFVTPWTVAYEAPPSIGFSRQEYWSGLPFPSPENLPNRGIEPRSPTLQADALPSPGKVNPRETRRATRETPKGEWCQATQKPLCWDLPWLRDAHTHLGEHGDIPNTVLEPGKSKWLAKGKPKRNAPWKWFKLPQGHDSESAHVPIHTYCTLFPPNKHFTYFTTFCVDEEIHFYTADRPGPCHWPRVSWFGFNALIAEAWLQSLARNWNLLQAATGQGHLRSGLFRCLYVEFRESFDYHFHFFDKYLTIKFSTFIYIYFLFQHSENEDHGIRSHHFMGNRWGNSVRLYFSGIQNHYRWWLQPWN